MRIETASVRNELAAGPPRPTNRNWTKKPPLFVSGGLLITLGIGGLVQKVIDGYMVKICQPDQNIRGNIPLTQFVVAVNLLGAIQKLCQLPLL